jgi:hypothetical protein
MVIDLVTQKMVGAMLSLKFAAFCEPRDRCHQKDLDE